MNTIARKRRRATPARRTAPRRTREASCVQDVRRRGCRDQWRQIENVENVASRSRRRGFDLRISAVGADGWKNSTGLATCSEEISVQRTKVPAELITGTIGDLLSPLERRLHLRL
jgi:hypothetical protein